MKKRLEKLKMSINHNNKEIDALVIGEYIQEDRGSNYPPTFEPHEVWIEEDNEIIEELTDNEIDDLIERALFVIENYEPDWDAMAKDSA